MKNIEVNDYEERAKEFRSILAKENTVANNCSLDAFDLMKCRINLLKDRKDKKFNFNDYSKENLQNMFLIRLDNTDVKFLKENTKNGWTLENMYKVVKRDYRNVLQLLTIKHNDFTTVYSN